MMKKGELKWFLSELRRRNVYKSALAYIVTGWVILQVLAIILPSFKLPLSIIKITVFVLVVGFPFWLVFSWVYELTQDGLKRTVEVKFTESKTPQTGNRLNKIILATLGIAIALLLFNRFGLPEGKTATPSPENEIVINNEETVDQSESKVKEKSIAVLAFADMSMNQDQEYFSDGISEEILNLLAKIPDLKVISRTSSFSFKGTNATVAEIGEALNVTHILEGSVRKSGDVLRITAQLINVANGAHLWSKTYDKELKDIFQIQDEIATSVTKELKATLMVGGIESKKVDPDAYDLFLRAKYEDFTADGVLRSEKLLKQSIAIDSTYSRSWALLALYQISSSGAFGLRPFPEAAELALASAKQSIIIDPDFALGYFTLARIQSITWKFDEAAANMEKALQLDSGNYKLKRGSLDINFASLDERIKVYKKTIPLDPLDYTQYFDLGNFLFWDHRPKQAETALRTFGSQFPNDALFNYNISRVLLEQGKVAEALEIIEKEPGEFWRLYGKNFILYEMGRLQEADSILSEMITHRMEFDASANIAEIYAFRGDIESAFLYLQEALEMKSPTLTEAIFYPEFEILYNDPRWNELIEKMKLPEGHGVPMGESSEASIPEEGIKT